MASATVGAGVAEQQSATAGAISTEKVTYRRYVKLEADAEGKTTIKETRILAETDKKVPAKDAHGNPSVNAGLSVNWAKAEEDGLTLFSENEAVTYDVKTKDGIEILNPDPAIQLYIYQTGLATIQTARVQAFMKALVENAAEPTPEFNQVTLDLRVGVGDDGEYSFNKAPSKRGLSNEEKLVKQLTAMGVPPERQQAVLAAMLAAMTATGDESEEAA
jgi:hypothetical protein